MVAALAGLALKIKSLGVLQASSRVKGLQTQFTKMGKSMNPQLKKLTANFAKFGLVAGGIFATLIASSPLLRARMEILAIRVQELVRVFGDALAPIIEFVTDLVQKASEIWDNLPGPMKESIIFGVQVAAVIGLVALAFGALSAAISPVTLAILGIIAAAAILHLVWTQNLGGIQDAVKRIFGNITKILENFIGFFKAIFAGDLQGAWDSIVNIFKAGVQLAIDWVMAIPNAILGLLDYLTGGVIGDMIRAGQEFFGGFLKGVLKAVEDVPLIGDLLQLIMDLLGGSLPEKGPLVKVPEAGRSVGRAYVENIGVGLQGGGGFGSIIERTFNIDSIEISMPEAARDDIGVFKSRLDSELGRSTSW